MPLRARRRLLRDDGAARVIGRSHFGERRRPTRPSCCSRNCAAALGLAGQRGDDGDPRPLAHPDPNAALAARDGAGRRLLQRDAARGNLRIEAAAFVDGQREAVVLRAVAVASATVWLRRSGTGTSRTFSATRIAVTAKSR